MNGVRTLKGGRIKRIEPFKRDLAPSLQLQAFAQQPYNHARIRHPMVRKSWLEKGHRAGGEGRGSCLLYTSFFKDSREKGPRLPSAGKRGLCVCRLTLSEAARRQR